jgi:hypothetical protein
MALLLLQEGRVCVMGQKQMCHFSRCPNFKIFERGQSPGRKYRVILTRRGFLKAGINPVITSRDAVYLHLRLAHNGPAV